MDADRVALRRVAPGQFGVLAREAIGRRRLPVHLELTILTAGWSVGAGGKIASA